jgi:flagellar assembly protein FliH
MKRDTLQSADVQPFGFAENPVDKQRPATLSSWPDTAPIPVSSPNISPSFDEAFNSAADFSPLENHGRQKGSWQGESAQVETYEQKVEATMSRYAESIIEVGRLRSSLHMQVEHEVVKIALEVAKKIIYWEVKEDREIIQTLVRVVLGHIAEKSAVTIRLNPIDYDYLLERRAELSLVEGQGITLLADQSIERGGCLIQNDCGDIDAYIEEKLREVASYVRSLKNR